MSEDQYRKGVSVVVCCYNSSARLPETLNHLMNQTVPNHIEWEVVIVDNKSTDNTIELCNSTFKANKFYRYKIVSELNQGLSYARKKGLDTALYDYIIYCDDDNWLDSNYIANAYRLMSYNTNIGACGGIGQPVTDNDPPKYFKDFAIGFAVGEQGNEEGPTQRDTLYGAGLIVRKSILVSLYNNGFVTKLSDRKGNNITSCGDSELTLIIKAVGYELWYSPTLTFKHYIPTNRQDWAYIKKLYSSFGEGIGKLLPYYVLIRDKDPKPWLFYFSSYIYKIFKSILRIKPLKQKEIDIIYNINLIKSLLKDRNFFHDNILQLSSFKKNNLSKKLS